MSALRWEKNKMTKRPWSGNCCFLIILMLSAALPVAAQYRDNLGGNWNNPTSATITNIIMDRMAQRRLQERLAAKHSGAASSPATRRPENATRPDNASLQFRPTGTQLKTREIANLIDAGNPQVLALMTTLLTEYEKGARAAGKPNDLALALSFFLATNASVYHDGGQPPDAQMLDLREVIADALLEGNAMNGITDRHKQEMYESLVLFTGFALAAYQEGKEGNNAASVAVGRQLAGQNLLAVTGISPDKITFTAQGLSIDRDPSEVTSTSAQPTAAAPAALNAGKLVMDFEANEVHAAQVYVGKRIRVNGSVNSIDILKDGRITLTFHSPAAGYAHTRCYFNKSQSSRLAEMKGGEQVTVEGTVRGFDGSLKRFVELENCTVP
jgi:tRNA_anti-like